MWNRPDVDFIQTQDVPWIPIPENQFAGGGLHKILSRDADDGAVTSVVRFQNRVRGRLAAGADVFVLEGSGMLNQYEIGRSSYVHLFAGAELDWQPYTRTAIFFGSFGEPTFVAAGGSGVSDLTIVDTERVPWISAGWAAEGTLDPGAAMKWLRREGPGLVLLAAMLPGWRSEPEESHPIYEESFKLEGDILMGRRGVMRPGAYFYRGPDVKHAPLYTRAGTMSLIRWSAEATTTFTTPEEGADAQSLIPLAYGSQSSPVFKPYE